MIVIVQRIVLTMFFLAVISSCSSSEDQEQPGIIERTTEKIAGDVVSSIKNPIDQAKRAKELAESHNRSVEKAIKQQ